MTFVSRHVNIYSQIHAVQATGAANRAIYTLASALVDADIQPASERALAAAGLDMSIESAMLFLSIAASSGIVKGYVIEDTLTSRWYEVLFPAQLHDAGGFADHATVMLQRLPAAPSMA